MAFDGAISQQSVEGNNGKAAQKILRNKSYSMKVAMGADKRCAASEWTLKVEFATRKYTACEKLC